MLKLKEASSFPLYPKAPFHFDGTFHKPSHFEDGVGAWEHGKFWQTMRQGKNIFGLRIEDKERAGCPELKVSVFSKDKISGKSLDLLKKEIVWRNELDRDLSDFKKAARSDKRFYPIFKKWMGMRSSTSDSLYELLIIGILLQNATIRRTVQMTKTLLENYGTEVEFDERKLYCIWPPERMESVSEEDLRNLKLGYRAKFIKKLSFDFSNGKIEEEKLRQLDKEAVEKELTNIYGVGPETARILLFEVFHFYDTFDHIAPWQQKIYSRLFYGKESVPVKKIQKDIKTAYGKFSMLAVHYIWEDVFWRRKNEKIPWLEKEIRL
jgi:3-methyladenine DNA glycosylase/8-oxoguanine DNA glycosylase